MPDVPDRFTFRDPADRLIVAVDASSIEAAEEIAAPLEGAVRWFKVGSALYTAVGPAAAARLGVDLLNVHASGGSAMLRAARGAAECAGGPTGQGAPAVIAVTLLTSVDPAVMDEAGIRGTAQDAALRLARLARAAGLAGVVASPLDAAAIRAACGPEFLIVCPGVRPAGSDHADQRRVQAPREAIAAGADMLVVGRPITRAPDPRRAVEEILREIGLGLAHRARGQAESRAT